MVRGEKLVFKRLPFRIGNTQIQINYYPNIFIMRSFTCFYYVFFAVFNFDLTRGISIIKMQYLPTIVPGHN